MPMNMGIHRKPIGHHYSVFLDSRVRGNDGDLGARQKPCTRTGVYSFPENTFSNEFPKALLNVRKF